MRMDTMYFSTLMNDGKGLYYDFGDNVINILPANVRPQSIDRVERYENMDTQSTVLAVKFTNGHVANLKLRIDRGGVRVEDLKEFQARCIMIHDI